VLSYKPLAFKANCLKAVVAWSKVAKVTHDDGMASLEGFELPARYC
jgi:hypothetical protein